MLSQNLRNIIKNEILSDPDGHGYAEFLSHPAQLAGMLNRSQHKTIFAKRSITDPWEYLLAIEEKTDIENIGFIKYVVSQMSSESMGTMSSLVDDSAEPLLNLLRYGGVDMFLNTLGIAHLVPEAEKQVFADACDQVLEYAFLTGVQEVRVKVDPDGGPPRVAELFQYIEGAPNFVTEQDIVDALGEQ